MRCPQADNLLVHEEGRILLADFGATAKLERIEFSAPLGASGPSAASLASIAESPDTSVHSGSAFGSEGSTPLVHAPALCAGLGFRGRVGVNPGYCCPAHEAIQMMTLGSDACEPFYHAFCLPCPQMHAKPCIIQNCAVLVQSPRNGVASSLHIRNFKRLCCLRPVRVKLSRA